jgi:hypothetical protein
MSNLRHKIYFATEACSNLSLPLRCVADNNLLLFVICQPWCNAPEGCETATKDGADTRTRYKQKPNLFP